MDDDFERMVIGVRADTAAFARDVATMRREIDGPLQAGADRAGRGIETALARAARTGRLGFEELKQVAMASLNEIAASALRGGLQSLLGGGGGQGGGVGGGLLSLLSGLFDRPGRATGGPVAAGRPYWVGERGPELFVPGAAGRVEPVGGGGPREVRVAINVNAASGAAPAALARSSRQVARAVRRAIEEAV